MTDIKICGESLVDSYTPLKWETQEVLDSCIQLSERDDGDDDDITGNILASYKLM